MKIENRRKGSCTTVLVGRRASIDGSTMIARNDDGHEALDPQRFIVIQPEEQPRHYKAVLSDLELDLPENPLRYTSTPNAVLKEIQGAGHGFRGAQQEEATKYIVDFVKENT